MVKLCCGTKIDRSASSKQVEVLPFGDHKIFVHRTNCVDALSLGAQCEFEIGDAYKLGRKPQAVRVTIRVNAAGLDALAKGIPGGAREHDHRTHSATYPGVFSVPHANTAISRGFHVFPLTPKDKLPLPGTHGFKDSKPPSDPAALAPWNQEPSLQHRDQPGRL